MMEKILQEAFPHFGEVLVGELLSNAEFLELKDGECLSPLALYNHHTFVIEGSIKVLEKIRGQYFLLFRSRQGEGIDLPESSRNKRDFKYSSEGKSALMSLPQELSNSWMCAYPAWQLELRKSREQITQKILDTLWYSGDCLENRILAYLKDLAKSQQAPELNVTHSELAEEIGSVREVVSRSLKKMEKQGLLKLFRGKITLEPIHYQSEV